MQSDCSSLETLTHEEQTYLLNSEYVMQPVFSDLLPQAPQTAAELCTPAICDALERIYLEDGEPAFMQRQQEIIELAKNAKGIHVTEVRALLKSVYNRAKQLFKAMQQDEQREQMQKKREAARQSCKYPDFTIDRYGTIHLQPTYANFKVMCKLYGISIQSNMIRRRMMIPEDIRSRHGINEAENGYMLAIQDQCVREGILTKPNLNYIRAWMKAAADEHSFNPIRNYLEQQAQVYQIPPEQCGAAMRQVFDCLQFDTDIAPEQYNTYGRMFVKWLVQCVAMAHNEQGSYGAEFVLVLQSKRQGIGKTSFFRELCNVPELKDYFLEGRSMNPDNKDNVLENTACWICELGELESTTRKREMDKLKAFLTNSSDRVRAPYDAADSTYPRFTCYAGTVNEADFLRESGRRFVVFPIIGVDLGKLKAQDMNRLWAEAYQVYCFDHNAFRLDKSETQAVIADSEQFRSVFTEEQFVRDLLDWEADISQWRERTASEIARALDVKDAARVGKALRNLGYEKTRDTKITRRYRVLHGSSMYNVPPLRRQTTHIDYDEYT